MRWISASPVFKRELVDAHEGYRTCFWSLAQQGTRQDHTPLVSHQSPPPLSWCHPGFPVLIQCLQANHVTAVDFKPHMWGQNTMIARYSFLLACISVQGEGECCLCTCICDLSQDSCASCVISVSSTCGSTHKAEVPETRASCVLGIAGLSIIKRTRIPNSQYPSGLIFGNLLFHTVQITIKLNGIHL